VPFAAVSERAGARPFAATERPSRSEAQEQPLRILGRLRVTRGRCPSSRRGEVALSNAWVDLAGGLFFVER
jgi:hypothetical protein